MHHAYIVTGAVPKSLSYLANTWGVVEAPFQVSTFGIDHSRDLRVDQSRKVEAGESRHLVIVCDVITVEAQQALLKTFEEPTPGVHLFLLVPDRQTILPTLLSRVQLIEVGNADSDDYPNPQKFLKASPEERLAMITDFIESHEEGGKLRRLAQEFGAALLEQVRTAEVEQAVRYLFDRAAVPRLVLEHLAMVV